jgi:hypothetical protein
MEGADGWDVETFPGLTSSMISLELLADADADAAAVP